ncbi:hypothetical protein HBI56_013190 [Parastagonospora nodorum]|nr:hypothetical protein HBH53_236780 [Parastagonospora nodorum]KAH3986858.1 hypothetical protein HBH51_014880 [Parastagonospora nodorum]KAH4008203.1 hypothetical protein HBI13_240120 [Parastagonospora nodorum]KAH4099945.1 hypothetical protein HBH48_013770 [Parastagonospora nodorum]KAH4127922.1 hypothetical protein HBH47_043970 [Parastagonospora nodorum]
MLPSDGVSLELSLVADAGSCVRRSTWRAQSRLSPQPNSPLPKLSSPKPLPTHSALLSPSAGSVGPKAAGRARKKVELSSVRLIIAEGGKSDPGEVKDSSALKLPCLRVFDCFRNCSSCEGTKIT